MSEEELRQLALQAALNPNEPPEQVVRRAEAYLKFLKGDKR